MMTQNHLLMGAVIGLYISNPYLVAVLAVASHFIMDLFPFYILNGKSGESTKEFYNSLTKDVKYFTRLVMALQLILIIFVFIVLYQTGQLFLRNVQIGMFFALLPDILKQIFLYVFKINWRHHDLFIKIPRDYHTIIHTLTTIGLLAMLVLG